MNLRFCNLQGKMQKWTIVLLCGISLAVSQRYNGAVNIEYPTSEQAEVYDYEYLASTISPDQEDSTTVIQYANFFKGPKGPDIPVVIRQETVTVRPEPTTVNNQEEAATDEPEFKINKPRWQPTANNVQYLTFGKKLLGDQLTTIVPSSDSSPSDLRNDIPLFTGQGVNSQEETTTFGPIRVADLRRRLPPVSSIFKKREEKKLSDVSVQTRNFSTSTRSTQWTEESTTPKLLEPVKLSEDHPYNLNRLIVEADNAYHPCRRECNGTAMLCYFQMELEHFQSMSKACYDCPYNMSDCYRPDCIPADGVKRSLLVFNRMMPGPSIEVCHGDRIVVDVHNLLGDGTTAVHWHGQHQKGTPYMDGVPLVTQCPVSSHSSFRYDFTAATSGTHFYHSHSGTQRADGAFGSMIIRRPKSEEVHSGLYDKDLSEHTINIIDWSHELGVSVFTAHYHSDGDNKPPTLLVNGKGVWANYTRKNGNGSIHNTPYESFTVEKGVRYRFRMINAGVLNCPVQFSVDNHTITAISADGFDIEPKEVDSLVSYAGERWDFVLTANQPVGNYWIRLRGLMDCDQRFTSAHQGAVFHYDGASGDLPPGPLTYELSKRRGRVLNPLNKDCSDYLCVTSLKAKASKDRNLEENVDKKLVFAYDFHPKNHPRYHKRRLYGFNQVARPRNRVYTPQLNHVSLTLPPFPLLSQYEDLQPGTLCDPKNTKNCENEWCECTNVIDIPLGKVVEIILIDIGETYDANHPFHLHGHAFRVVGMGRLGNRTTMAEVIKLDEEGKIKRNLEDPVIKDTVTVPDGGYTIVRFVADNPGYWMLHCHIDFHVEVGMAVVLKVGEHSDFPPRPKGFPKCGDYRPPLTMEAPISTTPVSLSSASPVTAVSSPITTTTTESTTTSSPTTTPEPMTTLIATTILETLTTDPPTTTPTTTSTEISPSQNEIIPSGLIYNSTKVSSTKSRSVIELPPTNSQSRSSSNFQNVQFVVFFSFLTTSLFLLR